MGTRMAMTKTEEENRFIYSLGGGDIWIPLSDQESESSFVWTDGTELEWANWVGGEPNNVNNQDCAYMWREDRWDDLQCSSKKKYVCSSDKLATHATCNLPKIPPNALIMHRPPFDTFIPGDEIGFQCASGYTTTGGVSIVGCLPDGSLSHSAEELIQCE